MTAGVVLLLMVLIVVQILRWIRNDERRSPISDSINLDIESHRVSFLVPAWNAEKHVDPFVQSFLSLPNSEKWELVLCAGGEDTTWAAAMKHRAKNIRVIEQNRGEGKQKALDKALSASTGDIIFLTDIDCRLTATAVFPLVRHCMRHPQEAATGGVRPLDTQMSSRFIRAQWAMREGANPHGGTRVTGADGRCSAISRDILKAVQPFKVAAPSGTDYTLAKTLVAHRYAIRFVADGRMATEFPDCPAVYIRKQTRWLRNVAALGIKYGAFGDVRGVAFTLAYPLAIVALVAAATWFPAAAWIAMGLTVYSLSNRTRHFRLINCPISLWGALLLLLGDWAAGLLTLVHLSEGRTGWS